MVRTRLPAAARSILRSMMKADTWPTDSSGTPLASQKRVAASTLSSRSSKRSVMLRMPDDVSSVTGQL